MTIPVISGNVIDITTPTKQARESLNALSGQLDAQKALDLANPAQALIPAGMTSDTLIGDSLRCRLQGLGGAIEDLIEDGFGLGSILDSLKEADLSKIGDALKKLNPLNLLEKLGNLSLDDIAKGIGDLVGKAFEFVADIVQKTFESIERFAKGIGSMFDEFGDRIKDLGGFIEDTITGIVSGIGEIFTDLTQGIGDIIDSLLAPCPKSNASAAQMARAELEANKELFNTDIEVVHGNIVSANKIGHTSGMFSKATRQAATDAVVASVGNPVDIPIKADPHAVPKADGSGTVLCKPDNPNCGGSTDSDDIKLTEQVKSENEERVRLEEEATATAVAAVKAQTHAELEAVKKSEEAEENKPTAVDQANGSGPDASNNVFSTPDPCMNSRENLDIAYLNLSNFSHQALGDEQRSMDTKPIWFSKVIFHENKYWYPTLMYKIKPECGKSPGKPNARNFKIGLKELRVDQVRGIKLTLLAAEEVVKEYVTFHECFKKKDPNAVPSLDFRDQHEYNNTAERFIRALNDTKKCYEYPKGFENVITGNDVLQKIKNDDSI